jgi:hypothetical protein
MLQNHEFWCMLKMLTFGQSRTIARALTGDKGLIWLLVEIIAHHSIPKRAQDMMEDFATIMV